MSDHSINNIDFEFWASLASTDPQKFEQLRHNEISAMIDKSSTHRQERLRGLQWKIDRIREQHKGSTAAACFAISDLMWETFEQLADMLQTQAENALSRPSPSVQANIILFPHKS